MKKLLIIPVLAILVGCGGGGGELAKIDIRPLIEGKTYYEENSCNNPPYSSFMVKDSNITVNTYNDSNFNDTNSSNIYPIVKFDKKTELEITKDNETLKCTLSYTLTDKPEVEELILNCQNLYTEEEDNNNSIYILGYNTKESAHKNRYDGKCN